MDMPEISYRRLMKMKERVEESSYAEVLKNALRLFEYLVEKESEGCKFYVEDKSGHKAEVKFF